MEKKFKLLSILICFGMALHAQVYTIDSYTHIPDTHPFGIIRTVPYYVDPKMKDTPDQARIRKLEEQIAELEKLVTVLILIQPSESQDRMKSLEKMLDLFISTPSGNLSANKKRNEYRSCPSMPIAA